MSMTEDPVSFLVNSEIYCSPQPFVNVIRHYVMLNPNQVSDKPRGVGKENFWRSDGLFESVMRVTFAEGSEAFWTCFVIMPCLNG